MKMKEKDRFVTGRREDCECQTSAMEFLTWLIGAAPEDLQWDTIHHLQGHARCCGRPIVVIASRDTAHQILVFTLQDWDSIRRSTDRARAKLLRTCAIDTQNRLLEVLAAS